LGKWLILYLIEKDIDGKVEYVNPYHKKKVVAEETKLNKSKDFTEVLVQNGYLPISSNSSSSTIISSNYSSDYGTSSYPINSSADVCGTDSGSNCSF
jgi:hypothetical protein